MIGQGLIAEGSPLPVLALLLVVLAVGYLTTRERPGDRVAEARAELLLRELLTPDELTQLAVRGYLEVPSRSRPGRTYRIPAEGGLVSVHEAGRRSTSLCLRPVVRLPGHEAVLVHKLLLEGAEAEYWLRANTFPRPWWPGAGGACERG